MPNSRSPPPFDSDLESSLLFFRKLSLVSAVDSSGNRQSMPSNRYMEGYAENYHLETVMRNFGSGVPSMSIWGNQDNPFGLASINIRGRKRAELEQRDWNYKS